MKFLKTKIITVEEEISNQEIIEDLFRSDWDPADWEDTKADFIGFLEDDYPNMSEEEITEIISEAKKVFDIKSGRILEEAKNQLSNRQNIIDWLSDTLHVGYALTVDQIVDLIIQNGNKI